MDHVAEGCCQGSPGGGELQTRTRGPPSYPGDWLGWWADHSQGQGPGVSRDQQPHCSYERAQMTVAEQTSIKNKFRGDKAAETPSSVPPHTGAPGVPTCAPETPATLFLLTSYPRE